MSHRKWRETKQQLSWWPDLALLGCCLLSLHFLCDILSGRPVKEDAEKEKFPTLAEKYFPIPVRFMVMQQYSVSEAAFIWNKNIYIPICKAQEVLCLIDWERERKRKAESAGVQTRMDSGLELWVEWMNESMNEGREERWIASSSETATMTIMILMLMVVADFYWAN